MYNIEIEENLKTGDKIYKTIIGDGLETYICKKEGFAIKIGMLGTEYGSTDNDFIDCSTGSRIKVPDGIAHFLEHKLFEQEDGNALDLFAKMGVSANAYTSFDHTVYFFETSVKFKESLEKLFTLVMNPYFTLENVEKEKGIITQELKMYEDNPESVVYYNILKAMYKRHPLNIDIAGTEASIEKITKKDLDICYKNFYSPKNMFCIIIGDVDVEATIGELDEIYNQYKKEVAEKVVRFKVAEQKKPFKKEITQSLDVYMPHIAYGFKMEKQDSQINLKNKIITKIINDICFSKISLFYEEMYSKKIVNEPIEIEYECGKDFAYIVMMGLSKEITKYKQEVKEYLMKLKKNGIDKSLLEIVKKKLKGEEVYKSENIMSIHRDIIESIIQDRKIFNNTEDIEKITIEEINTFIRKNLNFEQMAISIIDGKTKNKRRRPGQNKNQIKPK